MPDGGLPHDLARAFEQASGVLGVFGQPWLFVHDTTSTNDLAARHGESGEPEGLVVVAGAQSAGRGRVGRMWASPPGAGLYVSVLLRPMRRDLGLLTLTAGVALAEGIQQAAGLDVELKWPNDLQVGSRKLGGILAEASSVAGDVRFVVLGFGINLGVAAYPPDVAARATSVEAETGQPGDRGAVLVACLAALDARYRAFERRQTTSMLAAWRHRARGQLGRRVQWLSNGQPQVGTAIGIEDDGALRVEADNGLVRISSGEVQWLP